MASHRGGPSGPLQADRAYQQEVRDFIGRLAARQRQLEAETEDARSNIELFTKLPEKLQAMYTIDMGLEGKDIEKVNKRALTKLMMSYYDFERVHQATRSAVNTAQVLKQELHVL